jgi:hypothetical protein
LAWRSGFLTREWVIARIDKGQGLALRTSPFDRRAAWPASNSTPPEAAQPARTCGSVSGRIKRACLMARLRSGIDIGADPADVRGEPTALSRPRVRGVIALYRRFIRSRYQVRR